MTEPLLDIRQSKIASAFGGMGILCALIALALFAREAALGHHVRWWNWAISSFILANGTITLVPALRRRVWVQVTVGLVGLVVGVIVIVSVWNAK